MRFSQRRPIVRSGVLAQVMAGGCTAGLLCMGRALSGVLSCMV